MCTTCSNTGKRPGSDFLDCTACDSATIIAALNDWLARHPNATPAEIFQHGREVERAAARATPAPQYVPADQSPRQRFEAYAKHSPTAYDLSGHKRVVNGERTYRKDRTQYTFEGFCAALGLSAAPVKEGA